MDKRLLDKAQSAVAGQGDGRISKADAEEMIRMVKDGNVYTEVEKDTMEYIRDQFSWTDSANQWFRTEIAKWAGNK